MSEESSSLALRPDAHPAVIPQLSPNVVQQLIANQARELELRASDLALQQQKDNNAFAFGKEALAAKATDLKDQRRHQHWKMVITFCFIGFLVFLTVGLIAYAMHDGKDAMVTEIIKAVIYVGGGAIGGYGFAKSRPSKITESDPEDSGG
jgi:hypothetical protein